MNARESLMAARFFLNIERIMGLCKLAWSEVDGFEPAGLFRIEGTRGDIFRAIVVFMHATFEDVLNSTAHQNNKKIAFYSGADIDKALRRAGLDPTPFKPLYRPLSQMAKRRKRIVHEADLPKRSDSAPEPWGVADHWQLIMWLTVILTFHSRLCVSLDPADQIEQVRYSKLKEAMDGIVHFGKQLLGFPTVSPEMRTKTLEDVLEILNRVSSLLKESSNLRILARHQGI